MNQINRQKQQLFLEIQSSINKHRQFLLTSHVKPDGDGLSSLLVFAKILDHYGKSYQIVVDDHMPGKFDYLPGIGTIQVFDSSQYDYNPDVVVCLDASDLDRLGTVRGVVNTENQIIINIDHHPSNTSFGHINVVDDQLSGTIELVYHLLDFCNITVTVDIATLVYSGIMCDTGRFLFPNTTHESLALCSAMVEAGASPDRIAEYVYYRKTPETIYAMASALSNMEMHFDGVVSCIYLCNGHYKPKEKIDTEGFIDYLLMIDGTEVSFFILETEPENFRVSLRSKSYIDVNMVAREFGGGGHKLAAGCTMTGSVEDIKEKILSVLEKQLRL